MLFISWKCKKQDCISKSSTEAKCRAMFAACSEIIWLRGLITELGFPQVQPTPLYADNTSAIQIAANPFCHERTKHIEVDCHFIRDAFSRQVLPDLFHTLRACEDGLKEFITWKLGTLVSIVRQHIRKYLPELLSLISELLWPSFSLPPVNRPLHGSLVLHLVEQLCWALNDEFRTHLPVILPCCIQVLSDAERFNDY
ncbi:serine/threonine-protein kinase TOR-like [Actinidia eriantha]|uniref:serine/threonine-protein kinase TOR-like n=1 Tax=Actinidia eriantha TaxID=165200 RepID=UPI00258E37C9|nr:serine/threonine-protein kinase TOR-like [Actinidia eriantha]XP_057463725.1 serine/threonine-protein kinase TOR-like [Actinidia eriantha]XP_057463731.1 serine/threonine-protein kinase TOR-like [Actinidia eriantha]